MNSSIQLRDCLEAHIENPSFKVPEESKISLVREGDYVNLFFEVPTKEFSCERMWVEVTQRSGDEFKGTLANDPRILKNLLKFGEIVSFRQNNIGAILDK